MSEAGAMQDRKVAIVGVLGGLGHRLAERLLEEGAEVLGIDNADPGAASPLHIAWQLDQLRRHDLFRFLPLDIRSIAGQDLLVGDKAVDLLVNCAAVSPYRRAHTPSALIKEVHDEAVQRLVEKAREAGVASILLPQFQPLQEMDPRKQNPHWKELLDSESRLREAMLHHDKVICLPLPAIIGFGQSLRTPPLAQYLQALSRVPVSMPVSEEYVAICSMENLVTQLLVLLKTNKIDKSYNLAENLTISSLLLSELLTALLKSAQSEIESSSDDFPPWASKAAEGTPSADLDLLVREISEWVSILPHVAPPDWPEVPAKERRIMRSKRRRAKRNRESGNS